MAQIQDTGGDSGKGKKRAKGGMPVIDMTPMVDLAFLLLTFFVMTTTFSKPMVMKVVYPAKPKTDKIPDIAKVNNALTFLLSEDKIFYYDGEFFKEGNPKGEPATVLTEIDQAGVRKLLAERNAYVLGQQKILAKQLYDKQIADTTYVNKMTEAQKNEKAVKVLIKTDDKALTKGFISMIDECMIADIGTYTHVDINPDELDLLNAKLKK
ncbi:MAG TPA: biopolymer transporter ExbD [Crocinitomicaceae bacterium]|nr:biopolymer transporter ExbD [Crocinitomicaceae bacterium]